MSHFPFDSSRYYYEPRVLWDVASVDSAKSAPDEPRARVTLDEMNFRNTGNYPVVLTHLLLSPVGYTLRTLEGETPLSPTTYDAAMSIINKIGVTISAPFSAHFSEWDVSAAGLLSKPTADPENGLHSSLHGVSRWQFDTPYLVPTRASVRLDLSTFTLATGVDDENAAALVASSVMFRELVGPLGGHARVRERRALAPAMSGAVFPGGPQPLPSDAFGSSNFSGSAFSTAVWDSSGLFPADEYRRQEANRGGTPSQYLTGFSVLVDQIDHDELLHGTPGYSGHPLAPLSQRIATRARTETGGTQEWWWRPGAPLALVTPSQTSALVQRLEEPIVLAPGQCLQIEVQAPTPRVFGSGGEGVTVSPVYNFGVSLSGFACVER